MNRIKLIMLMGADGDRRDILNYVNEIISVSFQTGRCRLFEPTKFLMAFKFPFIANQNHGIELQLPKCDLFCSKVINNIYF